MDETMSEKCLAENRVKGLECLAEFSKTVVM